MVRRADLPNRWVEIAAAGILMWAAMEELSYVRHRFKLATTRWLEDFEHQQNTGDERSALDLLAPRIMARWLRRRMG